MYYGAVFVLEFANIVDVIVGLSGWTLGYSQKIMIQR